MGKNKVASQSRVAFRTPWDSNAWRSWPRRRSLTQPEELRFVKQTHRLGVLGKGNNRTRVLSVRLANAAFPYFSLARIDG